MYIAKTIVIIVVLTLIPRVIIKPVARDPGLSDNVKASRGANAVKTILAFYKAKRQLQYVTKQNQHTKHLLQIGNLQMSWIYQSL